MDEKKIEQYLRKTIQDLGGLCLKWVCPGWAGVPDRICLLPHGKILFVELKKPAGVVAARQKWWRAKLVQLGFRHFYIYNKEEVDELRQQLLKEEGYEV